ncbi:glycosyltransferase family 4 protein [Sphaerotilus sp.]|jgi:glycosyltransferase involved in cell wall biosynthesis|uniref:glycosyltransferase family 4 protein n=1 Tax=Sphaerotilus sp. TaxID=2093942 RepID=UPI0025DD701B|nr:glycosyltransferase family 4 protein [Sphaerotilus sp.]
MRPSQSHLLSGFMNDRITLISNMPAPYREPVFEEVARHYRDNFTVLYCKRIEKDRQWQVQIGKYSHVFLPGWSFTYYRVYLHHVHWNHGVWRALNRQDPAVVITNGFNPSHLMGFLWAIAKGRTHVAMTDGWLKSEEHLTPLHRWLRRVVFRKTSAFIGASRRSLEMFQSYGAPVDACFQSHLCGDNAAFFPHGGALADRPYDLMFSGQFIDRKMPDFFCEVARLVQQRRGTLKVLLIGDGPLRAQTLQTLSDLGIAHDCPGFLSQAELPARYASAKLFLFPTRQECWGVVVNEACAAGTPVITCDNSAVDGELVQEGVNGRVLPLEAAQWAQAALALLDDEAQWSAYSRASRETVAPYTHQNAGQGIVQALQHVSS